MMSAELFAEEAEYLERLRTSWNQTIEGEGGHCPCCGKWGKVYKTKLNQHLALCLKWIVDHAGDDGWVDVQNRAPRWMLKSKTYPLLEHWTLIESRATRSGIWAATARGRDFVKGNAYMPEAVYIYDNRRWGFAEKEVNFRQCFGKHFDFDELMSAQFNWAKLRKEENERVSA
jgi:hypothetical protein